MGKSLPITVLNTLLLTVLIATALERNSLWSDSTALFTDVVAKSPDKARPLFQLGRGLKQEGKWEQAIAAYIMFIQIETDIGHIADAYNNLGRIFEQTGRTSDAQKAYEHSVRLDPHNSIAYNNLGLIYLAQNDVKRAIQQFRSAIFYNPSYAKAHANLGKALMAQGSFAEAGEEDNAARSLGLSMQSQP